MTLFILGIELCRRFYEDAVSPLLERYFPSLPYAAALIGHGSDVLSFDTEMSMDHDWGPRLQLFLREQHVSLVPSIDEVLRKHLQHEFAGFPVSAVEAADEPRVMVMHRTMEGPVNHRVALMTVRDFLKFHLAYDIEQPLEVGDWLTFP